MNDVERLTLESLFIILRTLEAVPDSRGVIGPNARRYLGMSADKINTKLRAHDAAAAPFKEPMTATDRAAVAAEHRQRAYDVAHFAAPCPAPGVELDTDAARLSKVILAELERQGDEPRGNGPYVSKLNRDAGHALVDGDVDLRALAVAILTAKG